MDSIIADALSRREEHELKDLSGTDKQLAEILHELETKIVVLGCGGSGSNTIQRITEEGITGAELYAINTDVQHLLKIKVKNKILIGRKKTKGRGAGSIPKIGKDAAEESRPDLESAIGDADMVFITCGLGGGTGTGAAPVISEISKNAGALTIAVVTLPFSAEGPIRMSNADVGLELLRGVADTVIVVPNDKLLEVVPHLPLQSAFKVCDEILMRSVKGITELIKKPGLVNLDFADVKVIMENGGVAMIGLGEAEGENKAIESVNKAIRSPMLNVDISGGTAALVNVVGGPDMTVSEAESVVSEINSRIDRNARLIWGAMIDPNIENKIRTMIVVTGVKSPQILGKDVPVDSNSYNKYGIDVIK